VSPFGLGDLVRLFQGDVPALEGAANFVGVAQGLARVDGGLGFAHGGAGHARELGRVVEFARQHGLAERRELFDPGIGAEQITGRDRRQQLGLEIRVGLLEALDRVVDGSGFHTCDSDGGV